LWFAINVITVPSQGSSSQTALVQGTPFGLLPGRLRPISTLPPLTGEFMTTRWCVTGAGVGVIVGVEVAAAVAVAVAVRVAVGAPVEVGANVAVLVAVAAPVGVTVAVGAAVNVRVAVAAPVGVRVGDEVGGAVAVLVAVAAPVGVRVAVGPVVNVRVAVAVAVRVAVGVEVAVGHDGGWPVKAGSAASQYASSRRVTGSFGRSQGGIGPGVTRVHPGRHAAV